MGCGAQNWVAGVLCTAAKSDLFMLCVPIPLSGNNMALVERAGLGIIYGGFNTHTIYKLCAINFFNKVDPLVTSSH